MTWIFEICDGCHLVEGSSATDVTDVTDVTDIRKREEGRRKKAVGAIGNDINGGHGTAVSLPRLIVGTRRESRVPISGNINSDATGFDITASTCHFWSCQFLG